MAAISRSNPRPLIDRPLVSVRARYSHIRMKEMLSNALGGNSGSKLFSIKPRDDDDASAFRPTEGVNSRRPSGLVGLQQQSRTGSISTGA